MTDLEELQAKLKVLSDAYAAQLPEKIKQIEQTWMDLPHDHFNEAGFETLHRMVHSLTGSGKTFGFSLLSDVARSLEEYLKDLAEARTVLSEDQRKHIQLSLQELHAAAVHQEVTKVADLVKISTPAQDAEEQQQVFVVESDHETAELMRVQLSFFGYKVTVFHQLADFRQAMQANPEVMVLIDTSFPEDRLGGIHVMKEIQQQRSVPQPVIFISAHEDFELRLEAVRAGAGAYLNKPLNMGNLIDKLDALTSPQAPAEYRVLIVDDTATMTAFIATVLENAGMSVKAINNPLHAMEALLDFHPDLILLDMYMPECNGMELAKLIRQLDAFVSIPIVFLSAEANLEKQLYAMGLGGDDFLTKPIQAEHLVASVTNRIRRSLTLRSFIVRDSLTGLLNHTAIKDQLSHQFAQAKRRMTHLSFAMLDIDHFKQVNDTYGHPIGDRVIKSLARLLKQRLRKTDIIGRYGGEEFAVVLSDADGATALKVMDAIRDDFSQLAHLAGEREFSARFSCGIADIANFEDPAMMCEAADRALYRAKHNGRNLVMLAELPEKTTP